MTGLLDWLSCNKIIQDSQSSFNIVVHVVKDKVTEKDRSLHCPFSDSVQSLLFFFVSLFSRPLFLFIFFFLSVFVPISFIFQWVISSRFSSFFFFPLSFLHFPSCFLSLPLFFFLLCLFFSFISAEHTEGIFRDMNFYDGISVQILFFSFFTFRLSTANVFLANFFSSLPLRLNIQFHFDSPLCFSSSLILFFSCVNFD